MRLNGTKSNSRVCLKSSRRDLSNCLKSIFLKCRSQRSQGTDEDCSRDRFIWPVIFCIVSDRSLYISIISKSHNSPFLSSHRAHTQTVYCKGAWHAVSLCSLFMQQPYFTPMWCCRGCSFCLPPHGALAGENSALCHAGGAAWYHWEDGNTNAIIPEVSSLSLGKQMAGKQIRMFDVGTGY